MSQLQLLRFAACPHYLIFKLSSESSPAEVLAFLEHWGARPENVPSRYVSDLKFDTLSVFGGHKLLLAKEEDILAALKQGNPELAGEGILPVVARHLLETLAPDEPGTTFRVNTLALSYTSIHNSLCLMRG